jgi:uncharacterized membrane protein
MVQADRHNYEALEGHDHRVVGVQEERTFSVLSHLSMFWLLYKDRSRKVAFHALESMWYQIGWLVILAVGWTVTGLLTMVLVGFLLIPVMAVVSVVPFVHAAYAAYRVSKGEEHRYPVAADLTDGR